jgi:hypothetical protein
LKAGTRSGISSPVERIAFHKGDISGLISYHLHKKEIQISKFKCQMNDKSPNAKKLDFSSFEFEIRFDL